MPKEITKTHKSLPDSVITFQGEASGFLDTATTAATTGILKISQNFQSAIAGPFTTPLTRTGVIITPLTTSIVTSYSDTKILVDLCISGEVHYDTAFILERVVGATVTEIGSGTPNSASLYGFAIGPFDVGDQASTMAQIKFKYLDSPNAASGTTVQYRIKFYSAVAHVFYLNRTISDSSAAGYERGSSTVILTEVGF